MSTSPWSQWQGGGEEVGGWLSLVLSSASQPHSTLGRLRGQGGGSASAYPPPVPGWGEAGAPYLKHRPVNTLDGGCHLLPVDPRKGIQNHPVNTRPSPRAHPLIFQIGKLRPGESFLFLDSTEFGIGILAFLSPEFHLHPSVSEPEEERVLPEAAQTPKVSPAPSHQAHPACEWFWATQQCTGQLCPRHPHGPTACHRLEKKTGWGSGGRNSSSKPTGIY